MCRLIAHALSSKTIRLVTPLERFSTAFTWNGKRSLPFHIPRKIAWILLLQLRVSSRYGGFLGALVWLIRNYSFGALFPAINFYSVREKWRKSHVKSERGYFQVETAKRSRQTWKNGSKKVTWSLSPFTFHVNVVLNLSNFSSLPLSHFGFHFNYNCHY